MFALFNLRKQHGRQAIPDIQKAALPENFRGFPLLDESKCKEGCRVCTEVCPTGAIDLNPLRLDMGKCIFCGECQQACDRESILFSSRHLLGTTCRDMLTLTSGISAESYEQTAVEAKQAIHRMFGRSLKLRHVSAAGCNGCEMELAAAGNVNFDMGRFGLDFVASPRHADGIVITGPVSKNMAPAMRDTYHSVSEPRLVISVGACAISGGVFAESSELNRTFFEEFPADLYIPGCPPHPLTFIRALLKFISRAD